MDTFTPSLAQNPLLTRQDAVQLLLDLIRPLRPYYTAEGSGLHVGSTAAHYGEKAARMEGWARVLWALGPLFAQNEDANRALPTALREEIADWQALYLRGVQAGTDPENPGYWGDLYDYDQKMVETASLAVALSLAPGALWQPLTAAQKQQVYTWMDGMNAHAIHPNNWRFFRVLTNMAFARLGLPVNKARLNDDFAVVEHCYCGDGWYFDGNPGQLDYYIPFAMHFYSLLWAALSPLEGPGRALFKARSALFAGDFIQWFADDGAEVPFGRSLTYRFAHSAFFSALALAGANSETLPWGAVRHVVLQNLRHWMQYPITGPDGVLSIGYQYPNLCMSEKYNAPGSPYWAFKAFLFLALPATHPFWAAAETAVPHPAQMLQAKPHMLVCHQVGAGDANGSDHVTLYPAGQHCMQHGNSAAKYEKFVYSNRFGFSVSRGTGLEDGAFDSALAAAYAGTDFYRMRYGVDAFAVTKAYTYTRYPLLPGVTAESWVVPCGGAWHLRIHKIHAQQAVRLADGGFALSVTAPFACAQGKADDKLLPTDALPVPGGIAAFLPWGAVAAVALPAAGGESGAATCAMVRTFPNTNLMAPLCAVPMLQNELPAGEHLLIHAFFGDVSDAATARSRFAKAPAVRLDAAASVAEAAEIATADGRIVRIALNGEG